MKGLDLAREYFEAHGRRLLRSFPDYAGRVAAGLAGEGSECFGFDDEISADHDYGPSFCLWLTDEDFAAVGPAMRAAYEALPQSFLGRPARVFSPEGGGRVGVLRISDFYRRHTGRPDGRFSPADWLYAPEAGLAAAVNGEVFHDPLGVFSGIRQELARYYPADVRLKKIAARLALMAQSGQYNYGRCMRRGETVAAFLALAEFVRQTCSLIFLLNRRYAPFYKWTHRALGLLPLLCELHEPLRELSVAGIRMEDWRSVPADGLNLNDRNVALIESICAASVRCLREEGLTDSDDDFLAAHAGRVASRIKDGGLRSLPLAEG